MLRWLAILGLVVTTATATARAKIVIMDPPVVRQCRSAASWDAVEKCLQKHGTPSLVRSLPTARLVHLMEKSGDTTYDGGVYLYVQHGAEWKLAGMYENRGTQYEVLGMQTVTVGKHVGFRVDVGQVLRLEVQPDGVTNVPALLVSKQAMFCGGDSWRCSQIVTSCDVIVRGAALWTFRGTLSISDNTVHVAGDRSGVGPYCGVPEQELLGWSQPTP